MASQIRSQENPVNVISAVETRRSYRHFDPTHEITEAEIERLISLAMLSPTPGNTQPWRFVVVRDRPAKGHS
jgi:nitroreductase